jgi:ATP-dependent RNA helicase RhlE
MKFTSFGFKAPILKALEEIEYIEPTPIQEQAIPLILSKHDVLATAQTGTGKTAAFALPIVQNLLKELDSQNKSKVVIKTLIVTPTRELAIQIDENISAYCKHTKIRNTVIFGGVKQANQVNRLKQGVDILVATPGRLLDLIGQKIISLRDVTTFVLDEADRMLDMGFIHDVKKLLKLLPKKRQSLLFSATMPDNIVKLSEEFLYKPKKVSVAPVSSTAETIEQYLYYTNKSDKKDLLLHILKDQEMDQVLIFSRTKHGADKIVSFLAKKKIKAAAIHGNKSQSQRQSALNRFKDKAVRVLVATDIAARGIDIDKLRYVVNFDIPNISETYVHRIGRAGRAGEEGISISISEPEENAYIRDIEKLINKKLSVIEDNPFPQTDKPMTTAEKKEHEQEKKDARKKYFENRGKNQNKPRQKSRSKKK